ncbi:MAG: ABC transporter substrate-binding protein [Methanothrix sp.]|nr:ABC transporter substrate-binding protein [Methanothrix sp.]
MSKVLHSCLAAILCIIMVSLPSMGEETEYPLTITDSAGRTITITMPVQRIIVLSTDHAEAVTMLGDADKIVAVSDNLKLKTEIFPGLKDKQGVGKWNEVNFEAIGEVARQGDAIVPDIIVIAYTYPDQPYGALNVAKGLEPFENITVVGLDFYKPENLTQDVLTLGKILNRNDEALKYLDWLNMSRKSVSDAIDEKSIPKVYFESNNKGGLGSLATYGMGSGINEMINRSGGHNIAGELEEMYPKVTWEWVVTQDPSAIIRIQSSDKIGWDGQWAQNNSTLKEIRNEIISRTGGEKMPAIAGNNVSVIYWDMMFGMDSVVGQTYLAKLIHPDADLHPEEVYREYLQFLGIDFPEDRIFVYPAIREE